LGVNSAAVYIFDSVLWLLVIFVLIALWFAAISDIASRVSDDLFTRVQLASMAAIVSVVAVVSVGATSTVLVRLQTETSSTKYDRFLGANHTECGGSRSSFVFSFGLERASYPSDPGAADDANTKTHKLCRSRG
jgi:formate hydrogenlyase subunit 4